MIPPTIEPIAASIAAVCASGAFVLGALATTDSADLLQVGLAGAVLAGIAVPLVRGMMLRLDKQYDQTDRLIETMRESLRTMREEFRQEHDAHAKIEAALQALTDEVRRKQ